MRHDFHYVEELSIATRTVGKMIAIDKIWPNPNQPRVEIGDLTELSNSIKEKGVLEPLLVRPNSDGTYMIIAGERRWRSSNIAGLTEIPCIELDIDDMAVAEIALIENLQRKDLTIWEEADGLYALREKFGYTHDDIAQKISKSRSTVTELMSIAGLPAPIRAKCRDLTINSKATLLEVARQFDEAAMFEFLERTNGKRPRDTGRKVERTEPIRKHLTGPQNGRSNFHYEVEEFTLRIDFTNRSHSKDWVLKALKQAFEDVKNEAVDPHNGQRVG